MDEFMTVWEVENPFPGHWTARERGGQGREVEANSKEELAQKCMELAVADHGLEASSGLADEVTVALHTGEAQQQMVIAGILQPCSIPECNVPCHLGGHKWGRYGYAALVDLLSRELVACEMIGQMGPQQYQRMIPVMASIKVVLERARIAVALEANNKEGS